MQVAQEGGARPSTPSRASVSPENVALARRVPGPDQVVEARRAETWVAMGAGLRGSVGHPFGAGLLSMGTMVGWFGTMKTHRQRARGCCRAGSPGLIDGEERGGHRRYVCHVDARAARARTEDRLVPGQMEGDTSLCYRDHCTYWSNRSCRTELTYLSGWLCPCGGAEVANYCCRRPGRWHHPAPQEDERYDSGR